MITRHRLERGREAVHKCAGLPPIKHQWLTMPGELRRPEEGYGKRRSSQGWHSEAQSTSHCYPTFTEDVFAWPRSHTCSTREVTMCALTIVTWWGIAIGQKTDFAAAERLVFRCGRPRQRDR